MSRVKFTYFHLLVACMLSMFALPANLSGQQVTVRGKVVNDETNEPVTGAAVTVEGTDVGTITGSEGEFTLEVPNPNATLVVSRVGFATGEVALNGRTNVVVRLTEEAVLLDEMVVVGYGTQRRSDVTGSVASISPERLEDVPNVDFVQALQGAIPGLSVQTAATGAEGATRIVIRGQNSILASDQPLIVLDGIPYNGDISEINQNDITSIEVLKDASAAAVYGSRGANGVILVTTKKGIGPPEFSYEGYAGMQQVSNLPDLMTGPEFAEFKCMRLNQGENCGAVLTATEQRNLEAGQSVDWVELAMRTGVQQQHNLSFSGGTEEGTEYYVAGSLLNVQGIAKNDDFNRYSLRVNLNQDFQSWLRAGTNTQMTYTDRSGLPASFGGAFYMNPLTNAFNPDGTLTIVPWLEDPIWGNPLQGFLVLDDDLTQRIFTSNFIEADLPLEGLSYRFNGGIDFANADHGRYYGRNTSTGLPLHGQAYVSNTNRFDWTAENVLSYERNFGKQRVDATALYSAQRSDLDSEVLRSEGFPNDVLTYHQANVAALVEPSSNVTEWGLVSQMGRLNYSYDGRYLLTLTARRDGFSGFGRENKYGIFPSIAVGWNPAREAFWPWQETVNSLKLRLSYGQNGNQAISPYQTLAGLTERSFIRNGATAPGFIPLELDNPNLKWETTTTLNFGADFGLWKNRLTGTLNLYRADTDDLLLNRAISPTHGVTEIAQNIGQLRNQGVEFQLSSVNVDTRDFTWSTDFNISANRNEILDLYGNGEDDVLNNWFIGHPIDAYYDYKMIGIWQVDDDIANSAQPDAQPGDVRIADLNGDGNITADDRTVVVDPEPSFVAGFSNTLHYRDFTLNFFLYSVQGVYRENNLLSPNVVWADVRRNTILLPWWTPENRSNVLPANRDDTNQLSAGFYEDASYVRLRDVTLSYDVPGSLVDRFGLGSLRAYISGRNLWTWTEWSGLDPALDRGDQRGIPLTRIITAGLNVQL